MTERQQAILETVIEEYIRSANPVGSKHLDELFNFGIKTAMIRQEMAALEEEGYLVSPHTSAGRVPTDKAYRFYISQNLRRNPASLTSKEQRKVKKTLQESEDSADLLKDVSRLAAELSREFSVAGLAGRGPVYTAGLSQLFKEPELHDFNNVSHLMRFMDELESHFDKIWERLLNEDLRVFIGEENPIREIQDFSVITARYGLPQGGAGFLSIIGPRRMDYRRNMALVDYISQEIERVSG